MHHFVRFAFASLLLLATSCDDQASVEPTPTWPECANERTLEVYQDREAMIIIVAGQACLTVDPIDIANKNYQLPNCLVPSVDLPAQYQVAGQLVRLSGRKKSCYGLVTLPFLMTSFGYKLEVGAIEPIGDTSK